MFEIVVTEVEGQAAQNVADPMQSRIERYRQTVDVVDLPKLIAAINSRPRKAREKKLKGAA